LPVALRGDKNQPFMANAREDKKNVDKGAADNEERFDDLLDRLRKLVGKLESGNLSLEDSLKCFEEGIALCKRGTTVLDGAEKRVEVLLARPGGPPETELLETDS